MGLNKKINHAVGRAIHDYGMICEDDRILVGISGGRDSLALLHILSEFKKKAPVRFDILPAYIDPGFDRSFAGALQSYINTNFGPVIIEYTDYGPYAHSDRNTENPCFLCARLRKKHLFETAEREGCRKIALGHHKDDIIETLFINIFYSGRIGTMKPRQPFFEGKFTIIRPLCFLEKDAINSYSSTADIPGFQDVCPSSASSKRQTVRHMLEGLYEKNRHIKGNIFKAMDNVSFDYLLGK